MATRAEIYSRNDEMKLTDVYCPCHVDVCWLLFAFDGTIFRLPSHTIFAYGSTHDSLFLDALIESDALVCPCGSS